MSGHVPVLPEESLAVLALEPGQTYVDCTAGLGGHALLAAEAVGPDGMVVLNDLDAGNLERAEAHVGDRCRVVSIQGNFAELPGAMAQRGLRADGVLADLGFSSVHVDDGARGFSFMRDGPLDMRYDATKGESAAVVIATRSEEELASIIREFGEERRARLIARKLVAQRDQAPIATTSDLAQVVRSVVPRVSGSSGGGIDPATKTFQAFRIEVNDEMGSLAGLLAAIRYDALSWLSPRARIGIVSFHSLEDRMVKRAFSEMVDQGMAEHLTSKPVTATEAERETNPRSRSAKLRAIGLNDRGTQRHEGL